MVKSSRRIFHLRAKFTPNGPDKDDDRIFTKFYIEAKQRTQRLREREVARRNAELGALKKAERKVIAAKEIEVTSDKRFHQSWVLAFNALTRIAEGAAKGDKIAAEHLAELATYAANLLFLAERQNPDLFKALAQNRLQWPIAGTDEPGWEKEASMRLANLCLGLNLRIFKTRFRQARGADANLPARRWAKAAVRVIEATRLRLLTFSETGRHFGSNGAFADFCITSGWEIKERNGLDNVVKLLPLSRQSFPEWKVVVAK